MHALATHWPGDNLHWSFCVIAPGANGNPVNTAMPCREQRRLPAKQALGGERLLKILCRVEHHFHDALHGPVCRNRAGNIHAESAGDRGAHLLSAEMFTFYFASLDNIESESL